MPIIILIMSLFAVESLSQDVPTKGASYFDYMREQLNLPYDGRKLMGPDHPYQGLLKKINSKSSMFSAIIPFGRSLQKMAAYPKSLRFPRVLIATHINRSDQNLKLDSRLFIGYVEPSRKLEVVSYNPDMGRFEFQIVENFYPGGRAQVRYARRSLCLRCHQGGTPIFAGGDWLEATAFNHELRSLVETELKAKEYFGIPLSREHPAKNLDLLPRPERFDDMTNGGAMIIAYQKSWREICRKVKSPQDCGRSLIEGMILANLNSKLAFRMDRRYLRRFVDVLGGGTIGIPSDHIVDHNPVVNGKLSYVLPAEKDPSLPRKPFVVTMASKNDDLATQAFKFYLFLKGMGQVIFTSKDLEILREYVGKPKISQSLSLNKNCLPSAASLGNFLKEKYPLQTQCFGNKMVALIRSIGTLTLNMNDPLVRIKIVRQIRKSLQLNAWRNLCCSGPVKYASLPPSKNSSYLVSKEVKDEKLKLFFKFCSECHLHQTLPYPFLASKSESGIWNNLRAKSNLIGMRLRLKQMPPHFAHSKLDSEEREKLLKIVTDL